MIEKRIMVLIYGSSPMDLVVSATIDSLPAILT
jgi:hypothetical protein